MQALLAALIQQQRQLEKLKDLLEFELHLISSREPETLLALLQEKEALLKQIETSDQDIAPLYNQANQDNSLTDEINACFEHCKTVVEECKYLTQINAKSVEQGQLKISHLRNLMVELRARESMTYDKTGKPKGGSSGKGISA